MTYDLVALHQRALEVAQRYIAGIAPDQWTLPTPCTEWDLRALVNHIVGENLWVGELAAGKTIAEVGDALDGDVLGDDPLAAAEAAARVAGEAFARPEAMEQVFHLSYGDLPGAVYASHRFLDLLIHGWDVARASGQDTALDPELVETCYRLVEPQREIIRMSGVFGPEVTVPADADLQTKLLALLGRHA